MEYASAKAPRASRPVDVAGLSSIHPAQAGAGARSGSEVALGTSLRRRSPDTGACPSRSFGAFGARGHARQAAETLWTLSRAAQRTALGPGEALPGSQEDGLNPHEDRERGSFARGFISIPKLLCLKRKLRRCAKVEVEAHGRRLHIYTRDLALRLKQAGYSLIAISGSPTEILETFLKALGFDRAWGTVLGQEEDRYTGEIVRHPFSDKRGVLKEFLSEASLSLDGSVGVGDTLSDVGFLELVETPIVFNPNHSLFEVARRRGWPIVVERKDVVYNLQLPRSRGRIASTPLPLLPL